MNDYLLARVLHIAGAGFFFLSLGVEWVSIRALRRASSETEFEQAHGDFKLARKLDGFAALLSFGGGVYLATTVWNWHGGWIHTGVTLFILVWGISGMVSGRGVRKLSTATGDARVALQRSPRLLIAIASRLGLVISALAIMVLKPGGAVQGVLVLVSQLGALSVWLRSPRSSR